MFMVPCQGSVKSNPFLMASTAMSVNNRCMTISLMATTPPVTSGYRRTRLKATAMQSADMTTKVVTGSWPCSPSLPPESLAAIKASQPWALISAPAQRWHQHHRPSREHALALLASALALWPSAE